MTTCPCVRCGSTDRKNNGDCRPCAILRDRAYKAERRAELASKSREYYAKNKEKCNASSKKWRIENAVLKKQYDAAYRKENPEKVAGYKRKHYENNIEKIKARAKEWVDNHKEYVKERHRKYIAAHPEKKANAKAIRRLRVGVDRLPYGTIPRIYETQKGICACCNKSLESGYHIDHIMPLALGGRNIPENIQLLTPQCNQRKSAKHPDVWRAELVTA